MTEGNYAFDDSDRLEFERQDRLYEATLHLLAMGELPEPTNEDNDLKDDERELLMVLWESNHGTKLLDAVYESVQHFLTYGERQLEAE